MADTPTNPQQAIDEASKKLEAAPPETVIISPKDQKPESPPQIPMQPKKKGGKGMLIGMLLFLILTLPVAVYYGSQQYKQITEDRSRAAEGVYPPWSACSNIGDKSTSPKGNCLECKTNTSGGPNPAWAPCGGVSDCPWTPSAETNNMCCPTTDACATLGDKLCVPDPFISICSVWNASCPAGHQNYWKHLKTVTSCDNITPTPKNESNPTPINTPVPTVVINTPVPTEINTPVPTITDTPGSTITPTITNTSAPGTCDASCDTDSNCESGLSCYLVTGVKRCRKSDCPNESSCSCPAGTATPTQTSFYNPTPTTVSVAYNTTPTAIPTPKVPVSGAIDVKAIVITVGSLLLLTLGLIL